MTLREISHQYSADAQRFARRVRELEQQLGRESDTQRQLQLKRRVAELQPLLRQSRSMAHLTEHYYDAKEARHVHQRHQHRPVRADDPAD